MNKAILLKQGLIAMGEGDLFDPLDRSIVTKAYIDAKKKEISTWLAAVEEAESKADRGLATLMFAAPQLAARVGNIQITADRHGMGFTCSIDGEPVKRLRAVTLRLEVDKANLVTVEVLPNHER